MLYTAPSIFSASGVANREVPTVVALPPLLILHEMSVEPVTWLNTAEDDAVGFHERLQRIPELF